jgi:hypothetical protein
MSITAFIDEVLTGFQVEGEGVEQARAVLEEALKHHGLSAAAPAAVKKPVVTLAAGGALAASSAASVAQQPKPTEPKNGYLRFGEARRPILMEQLKGTVPEKELKTSVGARILEEWRLLGDEGQKPYKDAYDADRASFKVAHPDYKRATRKAAAKGTVSVSLYQIFCQEEWGTYKGDMSWDQFRKERYTSRSEGEEFKERYGARKDAFLAWCAAGGRVGEVKTLYPQFMRAVPWG